MLCYVYVHCVLGYGHICYIEKTEKLEDTHKTNHKIKHEQTEISQPEPEIYLFAVGSRAGYPVCLVFVNVVLLVFLCCFLFNVSFCVWPVFA